MIPARDLEAGKAAKIGGQWRTIAWVTDERGEDMSIMTSDRLRWVFRPSQMMEVI